MVSEKISRTIKFWLVLGIIIITLIIAGIIILKYSIEGEKKLAYKISKISIISTAEGIEDTSNESDENTWNLNIIQINDLYLSIDKTEFATQDNLLTGVRIENIQVVNQPTRGKISAYMPNSSDGRIYNYIDNYLVDEKLQYTGATKNNSKTLEIANNGGLALISFVNTELGKFMSSEKNMEIKHDGTLISKINQIENGNIQIVEQELKFSVSFDLIIQIDNNSYKGNIKVDLPCGDLIQNGTAISEITDFSNVVFKKIK